MMESREEKIRRLRNGPSLDDMIGWILYKLGRNEIRADLVALHSEFFELSKQYEEFQELTFDLGGPTPHSYDLDDVLFRLGFSGVISCPNVTYDTYEFKPQRIQVLGESLASSLSDIQKKRMEECALRISNRLDVNQ